MYKKIGRNNAIYNVVVNPFDIPVPIYQKNGYYSLASQARYFQILLAVFLDHFGLFRCHVASLIR